MVPRSRGSGGKLPGAYQLAKGVLSRYNSKWVCVLYHLKTIRFEAIAQ